MTVKQAQKGAAGTGSGNAKMPPSTQVNAQAASGAGTLPPLSPLDVARYIDHTMLQPGAITAAFDQLCDEALKYRFFAVCVNSCRVEYVAKRLQGSGIKVSSVVGFPLGAMMSSAKAFEAREVVSHGASEIDMVINVGFLKSKDYQAVEDDILNVRRSTRADTVLKVIIETALLTQEEKVIACELSMKAGADFVKTCTGFGGGGATVEDVALMRKVVGKNLGVKASTGVRTYSGALAMIGAGATRLGCGSSVAIVTAGQGQNP